MGTVVNVQVGARSPLSGIVRALILAAVVLVAGFLTEPIPMAVLAGIALYVGINILDWSFLQRAHKGDFYALLGPNGAGKSTTIGIISSLVNKTSGKVKIFGYDIDTDLVEAKKQLGLVPQEFNFNQYEKVEQILVNQAGYYGVERAEAKVRAKKYLTLLDLWEKRDEPSRTLSGGMKRRLMIARALMHEPKLLILDEPTAGVDIELRRSMWTFLKEINEKGITIILTTHYLEEAEMLCRNIGIINRGELVEDTSMKALLKKLDVETFVLDLAPDSKVTNLED
eukprot:maker-scaffold312_size212576-snap-gene-0.17 protein:Tk12414 transcript:maker-scaffold312_size212576-snap-gene-0.17-mRNA-1 annotation:"abc transporter"